MTFFGTSRKVTLSFPEFKGRERKCKLGPFWLNHSEGNQVRMGLEKHSVKRCRKPGPDTWIKQSQTLAMPMDFEVHEPTHPFFLSEPE